MLEQMSRMSNQAFAIEKEKNSLMPNIPRKKTK